MAEVDQLLSKGFLLLTYPSPDPLSGESRLLLMLFACALGHFQVSGILSTEHGCKRQEKSWSLVLGVSIASHLHSNFGILSFCFVYNVRNFLFVHNDNYRNYFTDILKVKVYHIYLGVYLFQQQSLLNTLENNYFIKNILLELGMWIQTCNPSILGD